jgi:hypothetical protein
MKTFKTIAILAFFMIGSISFAQGPGQGGPGGGRQMRSVSERANSETQRLVKALGLDAAQTEKILEINKKFAAKDSAQFAAMREKGAQVDRETMIKEMRAKQEAKSAEIQSVLNEEQVGKYKKLLEEMQQRGPGGQGGPGQGGPGQGGERN